MTFRDRQFERDIQTWEKDDQAFSRLIRTRYAVSTAGILSKSSEVYLYYKGKMPEAVPERGAQCACCGYKPLINVRRKGGQIVGVECAAHPLGSCRRQQPA